MILHPLNFAQEIKRNYNDTNGFPRRLDDKEPTCTTGDSGDSGSISGLGRLPEEEMATHSSILAWRIPWIKEPGGLQSMGLQRVEHNSAQHSSDIIILSL